MTVPPHLLEAALKDAAAALKIEDFNTRRSALQRAVDAVFRARFTRSRCQAIHEDSEFISDGSVKMSAAISNFIQRLHPDVICWALAQEKRGAPWDGPLALSFVKKSSAAINRGKPTFGYPAAITPSDVKDATAMVATATATATITASLTAVVDAIDVLSSTHDIAEIKAKLLELYPASDTLITAAFALREARGERVEAIPSPLPDEVRDLANAVDTALSNAELEPAKEAPAKVAATIKMPDGGQVAIIDSVMKSVGLPSIADIIARANETASLAEQVAELKRRPMVAAPAPITLPASGAIPAGTVVMKNAADLLGITDPTRKKLFDFDVPAGEWESDHPYVPVLDPDYIMHPSLLVSMLLAIRNNKRPWLRGHTGTGKTTLVEQIYARLNLPLYRVNLDSDITRSELVGRDVIKQDTDGRTISIFAEGIIPRVMQEPCGLLLDEIDASRPDLGFVLQRLTEGKGFMLLEDGGRTILPNPYFRLFATANTNGRGDETGLYTGTRVLGSAFVNRWGPFLMVDYIDPKSEMKLIQAKAPSLPKTTVEQIVGYAKEHRIAFGQAQVTLPCSPRDTIDMAQTLAAYLGLFDEATARKLAFEHCVVNAADADDQVVLKGVADRTIIMKGAKATAPSF